LFLSIVTSAAFFYQTLWLTDNLFFLIFRCETVLQSQNDLRFSNQHRICFNCSMEHGCGRKSIRCPCLTWQYHKWVNETGILWVPDIYFRFFPGSTSSLSSNSSLNSTTSSIYYSDQASPALKDFQPFDLEGWWSNRIYKNITKSLWKVWGEQRCCNFT
jgi:FAM195 family